uniref:Uncharacterized protein n=1 Tax=Utricularia reniformis TaxID=192314 RepID=A0A1Y0B313_9LAMI|nr:hypothetical protein AEK19_MT1594 [Utricularia reniformis]ART31777.1 hypothetical protein AEK19_MT1594 [Utricularia reniformis]
MFIILLIASPLASTISGILALSSVIRGKSSRSDTVVARAVNPFLDKVVMKGL